MLRMIYMEIRSAEVEEIIHCGPAVNESVNETRDHLVEEPSSARVRHRRTISVLGRSSYHSSLAAINNVQR
jgi:hypothetical protein